jgi:hypothetical protein
MIRSLLIAMPMSFLAALSAHASLITATAFLDYAQEVGPSNPVPSSATGTATVVFDDSTGLLDLTANIEGIFLSDITFPSGPLAFDGIGPFHIHNAPAGANGGVVVPFDDLGFFTETAEGLSIQANGVAFDVGLIPELLAGNLYLNLHTLDYPSGEIRGQLDAVPEATSIWIFGGLALSCGLMGRLRRGWGGVSGW